MRTKILIYSDAGVSPYYLRHLMRWLRSSLPSEENLEICRVDGKFLLYDPLWECTARLLIIPGGADRPYHETLHGLGTARIDNYVREGGSYLGICAGAYFACKSLSFDEPDGFLYTADRGLGFFPGRAVGPAYGSVFSYTTPVGVRAAPLVFSNLNTYGWALFNGGPYFEHADAYTEICVEARYEDLPEQPAAIISRRLDKGLVVLSGLHIEYLPEHCQMPEDNVVKAREILTNATVLNQYRASLLSRLLRTTTPVAV
ncbi:BPL-N domain-containing protein [Chlamydia caviae]|uniref:Biotin apo-protein ligase-related protein n=1 Tax=Chlamydia caviae (strain ATCC VR-813 / DSM 19441 / 03DC25 / GPIC) TaxID=227941 RepID=Q822N3_CHLCV|nr:BPL-N domain-containing protein [Chlamydia caviae]AAP05390.1 biotin apo-protein ligase-related protein [Chlamydia caviae GPIC]